MVRHRGKSADSRALSGYGFSGYDMYTKYSYIPLRCATSYSSQHQKRNNHAVLFAAGLSVLPLYISSCVCVLSSHQSAKTWAEIVLLLTVADIMILSTVYQHRPYFVTQAPTGGGQGRRQYCAALGYSLYSATVDQNTRIAPANHWQEYFAANFTILPTSYCQRFAGTVLI